MKRAIIFLAALALVLGSCANTFTPTALGSTVTSAETAAKIASNAVASPVSITTTVAALTYGSKNQKITLTITNAAISSDADKTALISAVKVYALGATAASDGAYNRAAELSLGTPVVTVNGTTTTVAYYLDLSSNTSVSNQLEVFIDGSTFTLGGIKVLDLDTDTVLGEVGDDDYVSYNVTVTGAPVTAAGAQRSPRTKLTFLGTFGGVSTGSTAVTLAPVSTVDATFAKLDSTALSAAFTLKKFNTTTLAWDAVSTTNAYSTTTGVFTMTLPAAMASGEIYRVYATNGSSLKETSSVRGYQHRFDYNNKTTTANLYNAAYTSISQYTAVPSTQSAATYSAAAVFDGGNKNGYILITFSGLGAAGIKTSTLTSDNIKILDSSTGGYIPWDSTKTPEIVGANGPAAVVKICLAPSYAKAGHGYDVVIGPGATDDGASSTVTTDDLKLGDWTNVASIPYLFASASSTTGQI
jgi:hypothetical protein